MPYRFALSHEYPHLKIEIWGTRQLSPSTLLCSGRFLHCRASGLSPAVYDVATGLVEIVVSPAPIRIA
jgi:hypothetical protein